MNSTDIPDSPFKFALQYTEDIDAVTSALVFSQDDALGAFSNVIEYLRFTDSMVVEALTRTEQSTHEVEAFKVYLDGLRADIQALIDEADDNESDAWEHVQMCVDAAERELCGMGYLTSWHEGVRVVDAHALLPRQARMFAEGEHYDPSRPDLDLDSDYLDITTIKDI